MVGFIDEDDYDDDEASYRTPPKRSTKKPKAKKTFSRPRLYAIACGRGGSLAVGLYHEEWENLEFMVTGYSKAKYRRVKNEREGLSFISHYFRVNDIS